MERSQIAPEPQMQDPLPTKLQPRRIEPIFDASGTLRRVRTERHQACETPHRTETAERS